MRRLYPSPTQGEGRGESSRSRWRRTGRGGRSVDAGLVGEDHDLDAIAELQLHQDPLDVGPDRGLLDDEVRGDLAVREPARDQLEHLALTWGELVELRLIGEVRTRLLSHAVDYATGDRGRE